MKIILSNNETVKVPAGADPAAFRRYAEARLRLAAAPAKRAKSRSRRASRRINHAELIIGREVR